MRGRPAGNEHPRAAMWGRRGEMRSRDLRLHRSAVHPVLLHAPALERPYRALVHDGYEGIRGPAAFEQRGLAAYEQPCGASSEYDLSQVLGRSVGQHTGQRAEDHLVVSCAFECFRRNMDSLSLFALYLFLYSFS